MTKADICSMHFGQFRITELNGFMKHITSHQESRNAATVFIILSKLEHILPFLSLKKFPAGTTW